MEKESVIKDIFKKILHGFLFGLGLSLMLSISYYYVSEKIMDDFETEYNIDDIVIKQHEEIFRDSSAIILGTLTNQGSTPAKGFNLEVDLFDKNGKFIEKCTGYINGSIKPNEERNFKVSCGCSDKPVVEHESYKINVVGTF